MSDSTTVADSPDVVIISDVSKRFVIRRDNSLKERLVTFGKMGRRHREEFWALKTVSTTIKAGHTVALIGHNGSGKSTLLKVIGGIIDPTSGSVSRRGRIAALLELGAGFHPDLTGRENVFLNASIMGLSRSETDERFDDILAFSGIGDFIDTQVKFYSSGMYVRLAFAVAVHTDPDLLLVDEVLAVGDEAFQRKCLDKIRSFQQEGRTIVLVTHSLGQVTELCDSAVLLNRGEVVFDGDPREAVAMFRDLLEDRRVAEVAETKQPAEAAFEGRILGTRVMSTMGAGGNSLAPGDDLVIQVDLQHEGGLDDWVCAIQIDSAMGQVIYGTTTKRTGFKHSTLRGTRTLEFIIRDVRLGAGKYFINTSLLDSANRHLFDTPQAASFNVATGFELATGVLYAMPEVHDITEVSKAPSN